MEVYVCIRCFQASMMSAENDPLGPLPPGWGEFSFLPPKQCPRVLSAPTSRLHFLLMRTQMWRFS